MSEKSKIRTLLEEKAGDRRLGALISTIVQDRWSDRITEVVHDTSSLQDSSAKLGEVNEILREEFSHEELLEEIKRYYRDQVKKAR